MTISIKALHRIKVKTQSTDSKSQLTSFKEKNEQFEDKKIPQVSILHWLVIGLH
jgi:hypothetical protein